MLVRGYMNKSELKRFMDCGASTAHKAWQEMADKRAQEGIEALNDGYILTARAIKYLGLTEKKVRDAYEHKKSSSPHK